MAILYKLNVPLVLQKETMECWYASACMVAYYRTAGPRLGIPQKWSENKGITFNDFPTLSKNEGLEVLTSPKSSLSAKDLEAMLRIYGPIWCAGKWDGVGHIVVLTGVDDSNVYINDPNPAKGKRVETVAWFNQKLMSQLPQCMMYQPF